MTPFAESGAPVKGAIMGYFGSKHRAADWLIDVMPTRHEKASWTGQGNVRAERTEVAWCNRPAGDEVLTLTGTETYVPPPGSTTAEEATP